MTRENIHQTNPKVKDKKRQRLRASKANGKADDWEHQSETKRPFEATSEFHQQDLLVLISYDKEHCREIRGMASPDLFEGEYRSIATKIYEYIDEYGEPPGDQLLTLFQEILTNDKDRKASAKARFYRTILNEIHDNRDNVNATFTMDGLNQFVRFQHVKMAILEAAEIVEGGRVNSSTISRCEDILTDALAENRRRASAEFTEPVDILGTPEIMGWPELTRECLPAPLYRYVMAEAERLNADPCTLAAHALAACSTSISDGWRVRPKQHDHWTQQARLWVCVVKDVGARGTDMLRSAFWPIFERERLMREAWQQEHEAWQQGHEDDEPEPQEKRLTTQDATIEAASEILAKGDEHTKLALICDELVAFFGSFTRYSPSGAAARAQWLEGYDGGPHRIDRVKRGQVYVPNWSVSIAGNIQPRRLGELGKDLIDDGLFQRFMTVHARPPELGRDDDPELPVDVGQKYRELHGALAKLKPRTLAGGASREVKFSDQAKAVRRDFMREVERLQADETLPALIRETAPKWSGLLARLSLLMHLVKHAQLELKGELNRKQLYQIDSGTVRRAATFISRIVRPNLFRLGFVTIPDEGAPTSHARWIAGHILAHELKDITARDIGRVHRPLRGKAHEIERAMAVLCDANWAKPLEGGRHDSKRWRINAAVHIRFCEVAAVERQRRRDVVEAIREEVRRGKVK